MDPRISIVTLGVNDLKKSIAFFEDGLGWKKSAASQENIRYQLK